MDFAIGGLAASGAAVFSNPLDVLKTRMQLQGELRAKGQHAVHYRNVVHAAIVVAKNDGIAGLQKGLGPAVVMHMIRNGIRLGLYQQFVNNGFITDASGKTIFINSFVISAATGALGAFFGSPLFLIKTQLQAQAARSIAVGFQHGHSGSIAAFREIYDKHGIRGLWRGVNGTMLRALAGSGAQLSIFAITKDALNQYEVFRNSFILSSFIASIFGGAVQTIMITPFDLVSTRIYNQGVDMHGRGLLYNGLLDCFYKIWSTEGFFGFYKGVTANYMRLAPHSALCLVFWDILKDLQNKHFPDTAR